MTDHDDPARRGLPPGYEADEAAFAGFTRGFRPLADDLGTATGGGLDPHTTLAGGAFSRVGDEVGLTDAIRNATRRQRDRVNGLATDTTTMADAVSQTWTNYQTTEDDHDRAMRRAAGELA
jgi:hypothetical protein